MLFIPYLMDDIKASWKIDTLHESLIKTSVYVGMTIGTFSCSKFIDTYGRKKFIIIGAAIMFVFSLLSFFSVSWIDFMIYRAFIGLGIGIQMPAGMNLVSENIPIKYRSIFLSSVWAAFGVADLTSISLSWWLLPDWKLIILIFSFPMILTILLGFAVYESPRYLYAHKFYVEGAAILKKIEEFNNLKEELLNDDILEKIIVEAEENISNQYHPHFSQIFKKKFLGITLRTWVLWSSSNVGLYLTSFMVPKILGGHSSGIKIKDTDYYVGMITSGLITTPSCFISGILADMVGRKYSMVIFSAIALVFSFLIIFTDVGISYWAGIIKLTSGSIVANIKVFATEVFPTKIRGIGSSSGHAVGRFLTILTPFICDFFSVWWGYRSPFWVIIGFHALGIFCAYTMPFETKGRELDKNHNEEEEQKYTTTDSECPNKVTDYLVESKYNDKIKDDLNINKVLSTAHSSSVFENK